VVLFDDGSIWWKPSFKASMELLVLGWSHTSSHTAVAKESIVNRTSGLFPFQSVVPWIKMPGNLRFSRLSSGIGMSVAERPVAWDTNQDFYVWIGRHWDGDIDFSLFHPCYELNISTDELDYTFFTKPIGRRASNVYEFTKLPRECYVGEGNIVDVLNTRKEIWVLFDGDGGTGNLWAYGACSYHNNFITNRSDPLFQSYVNSKRPHKFGNTTNTYRRWCQFGQNRRVTTFTIYGLTLFIATPTGVYCIGNNHGKLCDPLGSHNHHVNWTEVNTSAFHGVPVKEIYSASTTIVFLLMDGRIFMISAHTRGKMKEIFKEITSTNEIVDMAVSPQGPWRNGNGHWILVNRSGSHYHRGWGPVTCAWSRDSKREFTTDYRYIISNESVNLCDNDMGYMKDDDLWM